VPGAADGGVRLASASQGTDREENPEGLGYLSAHMGALGQTRKVLRRRAFLKECESVRKGSLTGAITKSFHWISWRRFARGLLLLERNRLGGSSELGNGQDVPKLRTAPRPSFLPKTIEAFEVDQFFPSIGRRTMMLNARKVYRPGDEITPSPPGDQRRQAAREARTRAAVAHERIGMPMQEVTHRVKNSLQSIAAMFEARSNKSGEGKAAPERVSHCINALGQHYSKLVNPTRAVDAATYLG
jgi:Histidine kinase